MAAVIAFTGWAALILNGVCFAVSDDGLLRRLNLAPPSAR